MKVLLIIFLHKKIYIINVISKWIEENCEFDQLILEFYTPGIPDSGWVHVTYNIAGNRGKSLTASKVDGRTHYSLGLIK